MNRLAVIGIGRMGASIGKFAKKRGWIVVTFDKNGNKISGIRKSESLREAVVGAKVIVLAVSLKNTAEVLRVMKKLLSEDQVLVEITGVKSPFTAVLRQMRCKVLRLHPLFGTFDDLKGKNIILVRGKEPKLEEKAAIALKKLGAGVSLMGPEEHDRVMAERQLPAYLLGRIFWKMTNDVGSEHLTPMMKEMRVLSEQIMGEWPLYETMLELNPHSKEMMEKIGIEVVKWKRKLKKS